jgi:hypothetical protein
MRFFALIMSAFARAIGRVGSECFHMPSTANRR